MDHLKVPRLEFSVDLIIYRVASATANFIRVKTDCFSHVVHTVFFVKSARSVPLTVHVKWVQKRLDQLESSPALSDDEVNFGPLVMPDGN